MDSFIFGAYWNSRVETLEQVVNKVYDTLLNLSKIDEQFLDWYERGMSRKKALQKKFTIETENIKRLCMNLISKGKIDETDFSKQSFIFGLWTGHKDEETSSISFSVGGNYNTDLLYNNCIVEVPFEGRAKERLLQLEKAKTIINLLVKIWEPDYAVLTSHLLREKLNFGNNIGWITYRKTLGLIPNSNSKIIQENMCEGHLYYLNLKDTCYDYNLIDELKKLKISSRQENLPK